MATANDPRVVDTLAEARAQDLVHVDRTGRVRSRGAARRWNLAYWGTLGSLLILEAYLGMVLFGLPGLSIAAALGLFVGWAVNQSVQLGQGLRDALAGRLDEAERRFKRLTERRFLNRGIRARATTGLAFVATLRDRTEEALLLTRQALDLIRHRDSVLGVRARQAEAQLLARLGRLGEAEAVFDDLGGEPSGEVLKLGHLTTQLYLAFKRGAHGFDDDALHEMASFALPITAAAPLLALLSWAFEEKGDTDMRDLLRDEAMDRHPGALLSARMPEVEAWLNGEAPAAVPGAQIRVAVEDAVVAATLGEEAATEEEEELDFLGRRKVRLGRDE
jgi:hypothetical protein